MMTTQEYEAIVLMSDVPIVEYSPDEVLRTDDVLVAEFYSNESRGRGRYE